MPWRCGLGQPPTEQELNDQYQRINSDGLMGFADLINDYTKTAKTIFQEPVVNQRAMVRNSIECRTKC